MYKDFITSPLIHKVFGEIFAQQIHEVWVFYGKPDHFTIIELGGSYGKLRQDILKEIQLLNKNLFIATKYLNLDYVSEDNNKKGWSIFDPLILGETEKLYGCIISNEFFDSIPFDRFIKKQKGVREIFIKKLPKNHLKETYNETNKVDFIESSILSKIPLNSQFEIPYNLKSLAGNLSNLLKNSVMITIDYGFDSLDFLYKFNYIGTARCYFNQNMDRNILDNIGEKDITCDVNFIFLNNFLEKANFNCIGSTTQDRFLYNWGINKIFQEALGPEEKKQIISLVHPDGLGNYKVYFHQKSELSFSPTGLE